MELAQALTLARHATRLNQKEFAERLGVSPSTLCLYESGKRQPSFTMLDCYAVITGIPAGLFVGCSPELDAMFADCLIKRLLECPNP